MFSQIAFIKWEQNHRAPGYTKNYTWLYKENREKSERQKSSAPEKKVEKADLYKPVLDKIMTTLEKCLKYKFGARSTVIFCFDVIMNSSQKNFEPNSFLNFKLISSFQVHSIQ